MHSIARDNDMDVPGLDRRNARREGLSLLGLDLTKPTRHFSFEAPQAQCRGPFHCSLGIAYLHVLVVRLEIRLYAGGWICAETPCHSVAHLPLLTHLERRAFGLRTNISTDTDTYPSTSLPLSLIH